MVDKQAPCPRTIWDCPGQGVGQRNWLASANVGRIFSSERQCRSDLFARDAIKYASLVSSVLARASVPKLLVVVRKAYGGGIFMTGPGFADAVIAFPEAKVGPFGGATIRSPETPDEVRGLSDMEAMSDMERLRERGLLDDVVEPGALRDYLRGFVAKHPPRPRLHPAAVLKL